MPFFVSGKEGGSFAIEAVAPCSESEVEGFVSSSWIEGMGRLLIHRRFGVGSIDSVDEVRLL